VLQLRDRSRFTREASYGLVIIGVLRADDLDRDLAPELTVARAIHDRGGTAAKLAEYLVVGLEIGCRDVRSGIAKHQPARNLNTIGTPSNPCATAPCRRLAFAKYEGDLTHLDAVAFR